MSYRVNALMDAVQPRFVNPDLYLPSTETRGNELGHRGHAVLARGDRRDSGINSGVLDGFSTHTV
jgi:hypothetical protein